MTSCHAVLNNTPMLWVECMSKVLCTVLSQDDIINKDADSCIDDILVDETTLLLER